ncbi:MAG TPA: hypothetical protein VMK42_00135 [Anaeromyxobacteraceae bacterium]|nr:hypothetical protein [Anaeromyxobacteraceae bacterium]
MAISRRTMLAKLAADHGIVRENEDDPMLRVISLLDLVVEEHERRVTKQLKALLEKAQREMADVSAAQAENAKELSLEVIHDAGDLAGEQVEVVGKSLRDDLQTAGKSLRNDLETAGKLLRDDLETAGKSLRDDLETMVARTSALASTRKARIWRWTLVCLALLAIGSSALGGFLLGGDYRLAAAQDENAAASWANTSDGRLAYQLAQGGDLKNLARCRGQGWTVEDGVCIPYATREGKTYGWHLGGQ